MELSPHSSAVRKESNCSSLDKLPIQIDAEDLVCEFGTIYHNNEVWPLTDQDIVRYLINKQKFNDLWNLDDDIIKKLTRKSLSGFQSANPNIDNQILISVIVIIILETRFADILSLWYGVVQKARERLIDLVENDSKDFDTLLDDIRKQI